jgi:hypothetical protein
MFIIKSIDGIMIKSSLKIISFYLGDTKIYKHFFSIIDKKIDIHAYLSMREMHGSFSYMYFFYIVSKIEVIETIHNSV